MLEQKLPVSTYLAISGSVLGLAGGLFLGGLRVVNSEGPQVRAEWLGDLVFSLVYLTPFLLSLWALRRPAPWRAAIWGAAAVLGWLGLFTTFSGASLVLLPAALLLTMAALAAFSRTAPSRWPVALLVAAALVALVAGGWQGLMGGADAGSCWELVRAPDGETAWQSLPYSQRGTVTAEAGGEEAGTIEILCTSDVITTAEAGMGLLPLLLAAVLVIWLARVWPAPAVPTA